MYPCSGFRSGGTSAKTTLLETTLLGSSDGGQGKGGGVPGERRGGVTFYLEVEGGGRVNEEERRGGAHWGWEGVAGRGGGLNIFSGPKCPPSFPRELRKLT